VFQNFLNKVHYSAKLCVMIVLVRRSRNKKKGADIKNLQASRVNPSKFLPVTGRSFFAIVLDKQSSFRTYWGSPFRLVNSIGLLGISTM